MRGILNAIFTLCRRYLATGGSADQGGVVTIGSLLYGEGVAPMCRTVSHRPGVLGDPTGTRTEA